MPASASVWVGLVSDLVEAPADQYATRVGGSPVYPGTHVPLQDSQQLKCDMCAGPLSLVVQVYAPVESLCLEERCLYICGCTRYGCGQQAGCWKAIRCQLPAAAAPEAAAPVEPPVQEAEQAAADAWGAADDDWAAAAVAGGETGNSFDFSALGAALNAAGSERNARQAAGSTSGGATASSLAAHNADAAAAAVPSCRSEAVIGPALPEFYLSLQPEPSGSGGMRQDELEHVQQLLAAYQAEEEGTGGAGGAQAAQAGPSSASAAEAGFDAGGGEPAGGWEAEEYEEDSIRGVDPGYIKFAQRLAHCPQQCLRYSLNGALLWPTSKPPSPRPCSACGAARVLEVQLMPPLISMLLEAQGMLAPEQQQRCAAGMQAVADWEWATIAVFTCTASCAPAQQDEEQHEEGRRAFWAEEEVALVMEADCHTQQAQAAAAQAQASWQQRQQQQRK